MDPVPDPRVIASPDRARGRRLTDDLHRLAIDLDRQSDDDAAGLVAARWLAVLLEGALGAVAWRGDGSGGWRIAGFLRGAAVDPGSPAARALRAIAAGADLAAGADPFWLDADRGAGSAADRACLGLDHIAAARIRQAGSGTVLAIAGRSRRRYQPADEVALLAIAQLFLRHLERQDSQSASTEARLAEADWQALGQAAVEIAGYADLPLILNAVARRAQEICRCDVGLLYVREGDSDELVLRAFAGIRDKEFGRWDDGAVPSEFRRPVSFGFVGIAIRERRPVMMPEIKLEEQPYRSDLSRRLGLRSVIIAPVYGGSDLIGAIAVGNRQPTRFAPRSADLLETLSRLAAAAIRTVRSRGAELRTQRDLDQKYQAMRARQALLDRSIGIQERLTRAGTAASGLAQIARVLAESVGHPVAVYDARFQPLAAGHPRDAADASGEGDPAQPPDGLLPLSDPREQQRIRDTIEEAQSTSPAVVCRTAAGAALTVAPIRADGDSLGYLAMPGDGDGIDEAGLAALDHAAAIAAIHLLGECRAAGVTRTFQQEFLRSLLTGSGGSAADLVTRARYLGHHPADRHAVVIVEAESPRPAAGGADNALLLAGVRRLVEPVAGNSLLGAQDRRIVLLYPLRPGAGIETARELARHLARDLRQEWPDLTIAIGIGGIATALSDVKRSYEEALLALRGLAGQAGRPAGGVLAWDDLGAVKLLLQGNAQAHLGPFARQLLGRLIDYDRAHGTALIETVRAYLAHGGSLKDTAAALHLHPHSLRYRLQRAAEITGLDLKDADCRFNVQLALKILDLDRIARLT